jgi:hypothetical protein
MARLPTWSNLGPATDGAVESVFRVLMGHHRVSDGPFDNARLSALMEAFGADVYRSVCSNSAVTEGTASLRGKPAVV